MNHFKLRLSWLAAGLVFTIALTLTGCAAGSSDADGATSAALSETNEQKQITIPITTVPEDIDNTTTHSPENTLEAPTPTSTEPPATEPPSTEPPATTEAPHSHSYSAASTVAPSCEEAGYTVYECSCGSSYTDDEISATGHSWSDWTVTKEATSSTEGEQARTCSARGVTETAAIEKLPAEKIDTAALEEYGRQYGKNTYGYNPVIGTRAGYYPGDTFHLNNMEEGYAAVRASIDLTTDWLIASGEDIVIEFEGKLVAFRLDVEVVYEGGNQYCVWVYYG